MTRKINKITELMFDPLGRSKGELSEIYRRIDCLTQSISSFTVKGWMCCRYRTMVSAKDDKYQ